MLPDSSFDDLEISMKDETDPDTLEAFDKRRGRVIELKGKRKQTEDGEMSVIEVFPEVARRITKKRKRRAKKK